MNYDLAMMALEGIRKSPIEVTVAKGEITIAANAGSLKDLARLCLLLGGNNAGDGDGFDLQPGVHVAKNAPAVKLRLK